jgi:hypothetical protein
VRLEIGAAVERRHTALERFAHRFNVSSIHGGVASIFSARNG